MKSKTTKILALTAALCGLQLSAATPIAVWDGDFTTTTKGGWTLSSTGSTITDAQITIGTTPITITPSSTQNGGWYTVVYKVKGLKNTSQTPLATWGRPKAEGSWNDPDLVGAFLDYDYVQGVWNGVERAQSSQQTRVNLSSGGTEERRIVVRYHSGVNYGVWAYVDGTKVFTADKDLKATIDVNRMTILGFQYNNGNVLKGAVVTGIAIFSESSDSGDSAYTSYLFPTELDKMYSNRLSGGNVTVTPGRYGAITVPGAGYKATAFASATDLSNTTSGEEITGSYANIIQKVSGNGDVRSHTLSGWFCPNSLSAETMLWWAYSKGFTTYNNNGYKVSVTTDRKIKIVRTSQNAADNGTAIYSTEAVMSAGTWAHVAVAMTWGGSSNRTLTPVLYVNGEKKTLTSGTIASDVSGGENGATVRIGAGVSAAGIYVDNTALYDGRAVVKAASNYVVAASFVAMVTTSANWSNLNWSPSKPTVGADVKLIRSGDAADAKVTIDENLTLAKLTVTSASGKALTFVVDSERTLAATTYDFSGANGTVKIGGAGRVEYATSGTNPAYPTWTWIADGDDAWTGTFALSGFNGAADKTTCGNEGWTLVPYYNGTKSKFEFNGTVTGGWFNNVLFSVGELVLPKGKSITFTDGHSSEYKGAPVNNYCFTKLSGEGSITINTSTTASPGIKFTDVSEFTGTISNTGSNSDGNGYRVILGEGELKAVGDDPAKAAIHFTGKATLDKLTLNASNGVKITDDASLVFADKDSKLTVSSSVAVNSGVTIPVTIEDATGLTAGTALITWTSQPAGSFSLVASGVAVGEKGFKATKGTNKLTVDEDTATTYYAVGDIESGTVTTVTFDNAWLESAGVKEAGSTTVEVQANLNAENANGIKMSDVYLMGYEAAEAQNAAVILKPDQAQSNGETISLSVAGVPTTTRNGAVITYTALASADRNWESPTETVPMGTGSVSMALPTSGVLYYRVQANVALP